MSIHIGDRVKVGICLGTVNLIHYKRNPTTRYHIIFDDRSRAWFSRREIVLVVKKEKVIFS